MIEENGGGNDGVNSSVTFSLSGQEVEILILTGSDDIDATGSEFNNSILGNSGDNQVDGGGGNDTMTALSGRIPSSSAPRSTLQPTSII